MILRLMLLVILFFGMGANQPAIAEGEPELGIDKATPGVVRNEKVRTRARKYIQERGWKAGKNAKKDGSTFFVAVGIGTNTMTPSDPGWVGARALSFDEALISAKGKLAKFISTEISTSLKREYERNLGKAPEQKDVATEAAPPAVPDDVIGMAQALLKARLNEALVEEGVKPGSKEAPEAVQKLLSEKTLEKEIAAVAKARVSGVQVAKIFESKAGGKGGQFAVIAIQSDKLKRMADAIASQNYASLPSGKPKRPIVDQIPTDPEVLATMFGVTQTRDESGRFVMVSYGQSFPFLEDDEDELEMAFDSAQLEAEAYIRNFAAENVEVFQSMKKGTSLKTLAKDKKQREFHQSDKKRIEAIAESLKITGLENVYEAEMSHPFTGRQMVVSVVTWSPESGMSGRALGKSMEAPPPGVGGSQGSGDQWGKGDYGSGYSAEGQDVDEEDF